MKNYSIIAINKITNSIEHAATSDSPFLINPFESFDPTVYAMESMEFDNDDTASLVVARELLNNIELHVATGAVVIKQAAVRKSRFNKLAASISMELTP